MLIYVMKRDETIVRGPGTFVPDDDPDYVVVKRITEEEAIALFENGEDFLKNAGIIKSGPSPFEKRLAAYKEKVGRDLFQGEIAALEFGYYHD